MTGSLYVRLEKRPLFRAKVLMARMFKCSFVIVGTEQSVVSLLNPFLVGLRI